MFRVILMVLCAVFVTRNVYAGNFQISNDRTVAIMIATDIDNNFTIDELPPSIRLIVIDHNDGGFVNVAVREGEKARKRGISMHVLNYCHSACGIFIMSVPVRTATLHARFIVHTTQVKFAKSQEERASERRLTSLWYQRYGADPDFVRFWMEQDVGDANLNAKGALRIGMITGIVNSNQPNLYDMNSNPKFIPPEPKDDLSYLLKVDVD